jgi:hypothetical protein
MISRIVVAPLLGLSSKVIDTAKNSRHYYKTALQAAITDLRSCHEHLSKASSMITDDSHMQHNQWLQEFDTQLFRMAENLSEYERTI